MLELLYGDVGGTYRPVYQDGISVKAYNDLEMLYLDRLHPPKDTWLPAVLWERCSIGGRNLNIYLQTRQHKQVDRL